MVGLGEEDDEVGQIMDDLRAADVDFNDNRAVFTAKHQNTLLSIGLSLQSSLKPIISKG